MLAADGGHTATVKELAGFGADVQAAANDGKTTVMYATLGGQTATVRELIGLIGQMLMWKIVTHSTTGD